MAERLKAHAWKACVRESVPWVRIPLLPPSCSSPAFVFFTAQFRRCGLCSPVYRPNMFAICRVRSVLIRDRLGGGFLAFVVRGKRCSFERLLVCPPVLRHLTRSSPHGCLQRYGIARLPEPDSARSAKKRLKSYPIGYFHVDIAEVDTDQGKLYLPVGIDRTFKFAFVKLHDRVSRRTAAIFSAPLIKAVPYRVQTVLTDSGTHFTTSKTSARPPQTSCSLSRRATCLGYTLLNMRARRPNKPQAHQAKAKAF